MGSTMSLGVDLVRDDVRRFVDPRSSAAYDAVTRAHRCSHCDDGAKFPCSHRAIDDAESWLPPAAVVSALWCRRVVADGRSVEASW